MTNFENTRFEPTLTDTDGLSRLAADNVTDILNIASSGEYQGLAVDEGGVVELPSGETVHAAHLAMLAIRAGLADAYLAGRYDQIEDVYNSNEKRTIRAKKIGFEIDLANSTREADNKIDKAEALKLLQEMRGAILGTIFIYAESEEGSRALIELFGRGDIKVAGPDADRVTIGIINRPFASPGETNETEDEESKHDREE